MGSKLTYTNNYLIHHNGRLLDECDCCNFTKYWESPLCQSLTQLRSATCQEFSLCLLDRRRYVAQDSQCIGSTSKVCECQLFRVNNSTQLINAAVNNAFEVRYDGSGTGQVELTDTYIRLTATGGFDITIQLAGLTISDLQIAINNVSFGFWTANYFSTIQFASAGFLAPAVKNYTTTGQTEFWNTRQPGIRLTWNNIQSNYINYGGSLTTLATNIQTELRSMIGVDFSASLNTALFNRLGFNDAYIELLFAGALCGVLQPNIAISLNGLLLNTFASANIGIHYGDYESGETYGSTIVYFKNQTNLTCPYEDFSGYGPLAYDANTQCCPQRGCKVGPNQFVDPSITGYWRSDCTADDTCQYCLGGVGRCWRNLERTFTIPSGEGGKQCFNLSPFYFLFGKQGRFIDDPYYYQQLFVTPDCDYSASGLGCTQQQLPCNCTPQLFMPYFHPDVPWGPFGAYYPGIEQDIHKAYLPPYNDPLFPSGQSYLSANLMGQYQNERIGFDYRPWGWMKVRGTWIETKEIEIRTVVHRPQPFYVGSNVFDDIDFYIEIDPTSITNPALTFSPSGMSGLGCGATTFLFNCSGQTVGDFVDAMNGVTIKHFGCHLFAFCKASEGTMGIPASRIMNISSELYEQRVAGGTGCSPLCPITWDIQGPEADNERNSGCDLIPEPRRYQDTFALNPENPGLGQYYDPPDPSNPYNYLRKHPQCRHFSNKLPKHDDGTTSFLNGWGTNDVRDHIEGTDLVNCWVTAMVGCNRNVLTIRKAPTGLDDFSILRVACTGRLISVFGSGLVNGTGFIATGTVNTNKNGFSYTAVDCVNEINSLRFARFDNATGFYQPIIANTGVNFDIWLDDNTSMSGNPAGSWGDWQFLYGSSGNIPTQYNFSYVEPLFDSSGSILNNEVLGFQTWVRNRCGSSGLVYFGDDIGGTVSLVNSDLPAYCVPPDGETINDNIDCNGDRVIAGAWVIAYGCTSHVCRTEWYVPSTRCSCSTVYRCVGENQGQNFPHPFNQQNAGSNESIWTEGGYPGVSVTQPLIYVCDLNFHPECDIPMLVKVPFQIHNFSGPGSTHWQYGQSTSLPGQQEFCVDFPDGNPWYSNAFGWCQYIDPLGPRVKKQDIPRTSPSTAYIAERGIGVFCSYHPWNYDPRYIALNGVPTITVGGLLYPLMPGCLTCNDPDVQGCTTATCNSPAGWACASCDNWDRIENLGVVLDTGIFYTNDAPMKALFRPVLKNLEYSDVCPSGAFSCDRFDIDCGTACCECVFTCASGCFTEKNTNPWTYSESYTNIKTETGVGTTCDWTIALPCSVLPGVCNIVPSPFLWIGLCYNGTIGYGINESANRTYTTCGCVGNGSFTKTYVCNQTCMSGYECLSWINRPCPPTETLIYDCTTFPSIRTANVCCGSGQICACANLLRNDGSACQHGGVVENHHDTFTDKCANNTYDDCLQQVDADWSENSAVVAQGFSICDAHELGDFGTCDNFWTNVITEEGEYHKTITTYTACTDSGPASTKTYQYVSNWPLSISGWVCFSANLMVGTAGTGDFRFKGNTVCP